MWLTAIIFANQHMENATGLYYWILQISSIVGIIRIYTLVEEGEPSK